MAVNSRGYVKHIVRPIIEDFTIVFELGPVLNMHHLSICSKALFQDRKTCEGFYFKEDWSYRAA